MDMSDSTVVNSNITGSISDGYTHGYTTQPGLPDEAYADTMYNVAWVLNRFFLPVIIVVGMVGNVISGLVFSQSPLRQVSSSSYLVALSLSDTGFLISLFFTWLDVLSIRATHVNILCQFFVYINNVFSFLSVWYIVSFTVERYIAVCYPLQRPYLCTTRRARIVVIGLSAFAAVVYSYSLWTTLVFQKSPDSPGHCVPSITYFQFLNIAGHIDAIITLVLPFLVIAFLNIRIVFAMIYHLRDSPSDNSTQQNMLTASNCNGNGTSCKGTSIIAQRNRMQTKITKMLILVSTAFLVLNLPSHAIRIYMYVMKARGMEQHVSRATIMWQQIAQVFYYMNFGINFFLYSLCGKNFRDNLRWVCRSSNRNSTRGATVCETQVSTYKLENGSSHSSVNGSRQPKRETTAILSG